MSSPVAISEYRSRLISLVRRGAVGQALESNPMPAIIPCHHVLVDNGELGGFRGGMEMKESLLNLGGRTGIA